MIIGAYHLFKYKNYRNINNFKQDKDNQYELFISAFTHEDIVTVTCKEIDANKKVWLIFPEYKISKKDKDSLNEEIFEIAVSDENLKESEYINAMYEKYIAPFPNKKICIDSTGFNKPYLIYLIILLKNKGINEVDLLYTEPKEYPKKDKTIFSASDDKKNTDIIITPRDIVTGENYYSTAGDNDLFIINVGYDSRLANKVINSVSVKEKKPLLGFPSLQPIMYQENILNLIKSKSELGIEVNERLLYAPANNPFITAHVISEYVTAYINSKGYNTINNIYLSPLATKAQTIGMTLFYIFEYEKYEDMDINIHIRYPFTNTYSSKSSKGYFQINKYTIEFDLFDKIKK